MRVTRARRAFCGAMASAVNATDAPLQGTNVAAGAYVLPAWLTAAASSSTAWVPQRQQGCSATAGKLWAAVVALPLASLVVVAVIGYLILHVST